MDSRLKHRLAGATIIVALVVIFLPMLLEGPVEERRIDVPMDVPSEPDVPAAAEMPEPGFATEPDPGGDQEAVPAPTSPPDGTPDQPATNRTESQAEPASPEQRDSRDMPVAEDEGWAVQVGGFSRRTNAVAMRDDLRAKGLDVYVREADASESVIFRVRVGPVGSRQAAAALAERLSREHDLPVLVVSR